MTESQEFPKENPESKKAFGARRKSDRQWYTCFTFFRPDYTVGPGVSPDHAPD